ncbi:hypothetical protein [Pedobacter foliorum]|uniref:hypothetical protein n=1 Tax=Pedobacter foliorum TaxID=2739058 RepID=UPI001562F3E3|nr:hypothetical protein [Pedobacter foliorum]NRF40122.1 hypothetical protein [Pedobacter foliorum]
MKKLLILCLFVVNTIAVSAQTKTNTILTKGQNTGKTIDIRVPVGTMKVGLVEAKVIPVQSLKMKVNAQILANQKFAKDIAIELVSIAFEPANKRYILKCRIFNSGTTDIDLNLLKYAVAGAPNHLLTEVTNTDPYLWNTSTYPPDINFPFDLETELPGGGVYTLNGRSFLLQESSWFSSFSRDPNVNVGEMIYTNTILKPGESAYALAIDRAVWNKATGAGGAHRMYSIKIDPLNKIGDQNLSNNVIHFTMDNIDVQ